MKNYDSGFIFCCFQNTGKSEGILQKVLNDQAADMDRFGAVLPDMVFTKLICFF